MSRSDDAPTILAHPALAGRTLYLRAGRRWATRVIHPEGVLGEARPIEGDPALDTWRGGPLP